MSASHRTARTGNGGEQGFALIVLFALVGVASLGLVLGVQAFVSPLADVPVRAEANLATAAQATRTAFRSSGAFPTSLDALATASGLDATGGWRIDPFEASADLDYRVVATGVRIRSRGRDRRLGTGDDIVADVLGEDLLRLRQRARLRLVRAAVTRSAYSQAPSMGIDDLAVMRATMREHAVARRAWLTADAAARVALQTTLTSTATQIAALRALHACPPLPPRITGLDGLLAMLGMPASRSVDGQGRPLLDDPVLGVHASGFDGVGGTDDDM